MDSETPSLLDARFNPGTGADGDILSMVLQADGKVVIGGGFTNFDGLARRHIARLQPTGLTDLSFDPGDGADGDVYAVALQPDGN